MLSSLLIVVEIEHTLNDNEALRLWILEGLDDNVKSWKVIKR